MSNAASDYITSNEGKDSLKWVSIIAISLVALELTSHKLKGHISQFNATLFLLSFLAITLYFAYSWVAEIWREGQKKSFLWPLQQIGTVSLLIYTCGNLTIADLNYEAALQVSNGLWSFHQRDLNLFGTGFLGYGSRQYLINAIPTIFLGRSIFALQLGYALPFILGYIAFSLGFKKFLNDKGISSDVATIPPLLLFAFPPTAEIYLTFEQTISPLSISLLLVGSFLMAISRHSFFNAYTAFWAIHLAFYSYTPALALAPLVLALILASFWMNLPKKNWDLAIKKMKDGWLYPLIIAACLLTLLLISSATKQSNLFAENTSITKIQRAKAVFDAYFGSQFGWGTLGLYGIYSFLIAPLLILSIYLKRRNPTFILTILWVIAIPYIATAPNGYTTYAPDISAIRRSIVVYPILLILLTTYRLDALKLIEGKLPLIIAFTLTASALSLTQNENTYIPFLNWSKNNKFIYSDISNQTKNTNTSNFESHSLIIFTPEDWGTYNSYDYISYFLPGAQTFQVKGDAPIPQEALNGKETIAYAIGYQDQEPPARTGWSMEKIYNYDLRTRQTFLNYKLSYDQKNDM